MGAHVGRDDRPRLRFAGRRHDRFWRGARMVVAQRGPVRAQSRRAVHGRDPRHPLQSRLRHDGAGAGDRFFRRRRPRARLRPVGENRSRRALARAAYRTQHCVCDVHCGNRPHRRAGRPRAPDGADDGRRGASPSGPLAQSPDAHDGRCGVRGGHVAPLRGGRDAGRDRSDRDVAAGRARRRGDVRCRRARRSASALPAREARLLAHHRCVPRLCLDEPGSDFQFARR